MDGDIDGFDVFGRWASSNDPFPVVFMPDCAVDEAESFKVHQKLGHIQPVLIGVIGQGHHLIVVIKKK